MFDDGFFNSLDESPTKITYPSLPKCESDSMMPGQSYFITDTLHMKKNRAISRRNFIQYYQDTKYGTKSPMTLSDTQTVCDFPPLVVDKTVNVVDEIGRFMFDTNEGFNDNVPAEFIEPIHRSHSSISNDNQRERNHNGQIPSVSSANTACVQKLPTKNNKIEMPHSNYPIMYSSIFSRQPKITPQNQAPTMIICAINGMNRPIVREFTDKHLPKLRLFSCPNYNKSVFAPLPTEIPPPLPSGSDSFKFNPPKIEMCELCRVPVKNPDEHRQSESHRRRALDTNWDMIDQIIKDTQDNLIKWPYPSFNPHSTQ